MIFRVVSGGFDCPVLIIPIPLTLSVGLDGGGEGKEVGAGG
jgi:hypothetical protein